MRTNTSPKRELNKIHERTWRRLWCRLRRRRWGRIRTERCRLIGEGEDKECCECTLDYWLAVALVPLSTKIKKKRSTKKRSITKIFIRYRLVTVSVSALQIEIQINDCSSQQNDTPKAYSDSVSARWTTYQQTNQFDLRDECKTKTTIRGDGGRRRVGGGRRRVGGRRRRVRRRPRCRCSYHSTAQGDVVCEISQSQNNV